MTEKRAVNSGNLANLVGQVVGGFRLLAEIGRGGMGVVYKASAADGQIVAVKILPPHLAERPIIRKRFLQEAELAMRLEHPNLVKALVVGEDAGTIYIGMEFVDGETLADFVSRVGPLPEKVAIQIAVGVARALHKAHREGLIHRDVKPDNVLISKQGNVKLADLGLAKDIEGDQQLTKVDRGVGTPASMAPEQFRDAKYVDIRCDIYGLGYCLYVMTTGRLPFEGGTSVDLFLKKRDEDYVRPQQLTSSLSDRTATVIEACLSADPVRRPESARHLVELLLGERPISEIRITRSMGRNRPPGASGSSGGMGGPHGPSGLNEKGRPGSRAPLRKEDSFHDLADLMRRANPSEPCDAVKEEFDANPTVWMETHAGWMLLGLATAATLSISAIIWAAWVVTKWALSGS